jgi:hypothetical protein
LRRRLEAPLVEDALKLVKPELDIAALRKVQASVSKDE